MVEASTMKKVSKSFQSNNTPAVLQLRIQKHVRNSAFQCARRAEVLLKYGGVIPLSDAAKAGRITRTNRTQYFRYLAGLSIFFGTLRL